ncbi:uncharacterized protein [Rutidosis leptorrhynchoides]|uniref:uncharacterized protein n=1 Tax=Rutidosis leptorrhynchoides TaxID=125765 RepID=UPI003A991E46
MDSENVKMEVSALRHHLSDKAEHLPIKKRRFLFTDSAPPPTNTVSSEGTETVAAGQCSSSQEVLPKPDESCPPDASFAAPDLCQTSNIESKVDGEELVNASNKAGEVKDTIETSLVDKIACGNSLGGVSDLHESSEIVLHDIKSLEPEPIGAVEFRANSVKLENLCAKGNDYPIPITHPKDVDSSKIDTAIVNDSCSHAPLESECSKMNQEISVQAQNSAALDDRLNWDLNTVMDAWEEPVEECNHNVNTAEGISINTEQENQDLPVEIKSLTPKCEQSELVESKPAVKMLCPVTYIAPHVEVNKIQSLHNLPSPTDSIPVAVPCSTHSFDVSAKREKITGTGFSLDYNIIPSFDSYLKEKENAVSSKTESSGNNSFNHAITNTANTTENEKLKLSLVTVAALGDGVHQSGITFDEDDKSKVKRVITSNGNVVLPKFVSSESSVDHSLKTIRTNENNNINLSLVTAPSQENGVLQIGSSFVEDDDKAKVKRVIATNGDCKKEIQTTGNAISVLQSSVLPEGEKQPVVAVSSKCDAYNVAHMSMNDGKHESPSQYPTDLDRYNKVVCNYENFPNDVQARSEVDNIDERSCGYDSQFEDGEFRETSIQTWEGYEGEDKEIEHRMGYTGGLDARRNGSTSAPESSSRIRYPEVGSQKGADEISSVLLPEKLEGSDQVSGSEPNETGNGTTTEVSMKDASQSDQWKMNVSGGSDLLPENHASSSRMKDLSSIRYSSRFGRYGPQTEDHDTKPEDSSRFCRREPSTRDAFLTRSRFHMQGCSSSNVDDSPSRSVRDLGALRSSIRRGPPSSRGGGTWNRSPPFRPSFRRPINEDGASVDNMTNEVGIDQNVARQSFRSRLLANREEDEFRARLGLRPTGDTSRNRTLNLDRGRSLRYASRNNDGGPRGRYNGPANDEPSMRYSRSFDVRRRCISGSTSPVSRTRSPINDGFRRRSRSPNFRPDTRIRRPRSPDYRPGFEPNMEARNDNSPPTSRWVNYKGRTTMFDRRTPPPPINERLSFYDSSRKSTQNENYRSGPTGRVSVLHGTGRGGLRYLENDDESPDNGYRRGGFVRPRYEMGRSVKHGYEPRH